MEPNPNHTPNPQQSAAPTATGAITLRLFNLSDAGALMSWASDPLVTRFQRRGPLAAEAEAADYIRRHILPHPWYRAVCAPAGGGRPVGSVSVDPVGEGRRRAALGYRLAREWWGKGIATAAVRAAVEAVRRDWPDLERLEALVDLENPASQQVLEKAGFKKEGVVRKYVELKGESRDMVIFSLLSSDRFEPCQTELPCIII